MSKSRFIESPIQTAYYFQRERQRERERERERENESPKSIREGVVGWCDGAG